MAPRAKPVFAGEPDRQIQAEYNEHVGYYYWRCPCCEELEEVRRISYASVMAGNIGRVWSVCANTGESYEVIL